MATLVRVQRKLDVIKDEYFNRHRLADENRRKEYNAAMKIQSWIRGCKVRSHIRFLHRKAKVIQKIWRGYIGRKHFRATLKTAYFIMKMNFYNEMAVRIQKRWRGYYVRKFVFNYYVLKKYLKGLVIKNEIVRQELAEFAEMKQREKEKKNLEEEEDKKNYLAQKMHYLLSTEQIPGVFNSPYRSLPDEMELRLQLARPLSHRVHVLKKETGEGIDTSFSFPPLKPVPPIDKKKIQGPFRDTAEVLQQRYKPLVPTLRVATSITSVQEARKEFKREEWRNRLNDNVFLPFSNVLKNNQYPASLLLSSKYSQNPYGTKYFREEKKEKQITDKDFQRVFTSVHLFDKFGLTYSKTGHVV
ncbi:spermatogenesis-associated protein 17 [Protopterus annectens]|uniref:spermatogenesis-associated protein 17 n=1 Tax=Protopterus annectens TaxID=7888 RepID=UPI001CF9B401|nr:spermatogenesis-associated protein 17 [Protopterus annectens]